MADPKVEVRQPRAGEWIRVKRDEHKEVMLARDPKDGTLYLIADNLVEMAKRDFPEKLEPSMLFIVMNKDHECFLWPVRTPVPKEHLAYRAMGEWVCFPLLQ